MKELKLKAPGGTSRILLDEQLGQVEKYLPKRAAGERRAGAPGGAVMVVDAQVARLHGQRLPKLPFISIEASEANKTLGTADKIYQFFMREGLDRDGFVLAVGGGIVLDVAGFAASTYLRGVKFGYAPTTLLAMADAALGGKTGVNVQGYKNQVGTFSQPQFVLEDLEVLGTLPEAEVRNGFAEIIKHAAIADAKLFEYLEVHAREALALERETMRFILQRSIMAKISIVQKDEKEQGARRLLNFGHTLGHAVEKTRKKSHWQAVAIGMALAARMSARGKRLADAECERLISLLRSFGLPTELEGGRAALLDAISHDKKKAGQEVHFVLLEGIGRARVVPVKLEELERELK